MPTIVDNTTYPLRANIFAHKDIAPFGSRNIGKNKGVGENIGASQKKKIM